MKKKNILVIDDNTELAQLICNTLEATGFAIDVKNDGEEGLKAILANAPDLVIMDIVMGNTTGTELLVRLQKKGKDKIPFVLISGSNMMGKLLKEKNSHNRYFLAKPFDFSELVSIVNHYFKNSTFNNFVKS
jgi:two-component system OmpR family response regulator